MTERNIEPIFTELEKEDRYLLDSLVFDILELTPDKCNQVYAALKIMVRSVKKIELKRLGVCERIDWNNRKVNLKMSLRIPF